MFAASGQGIELHHPPHAGRLIQQYVVRVRNANYGVSVYSDDHGATWRAGAPLGPGVDENKVVELADGTLQLNARARPWRLVARSDDGGETWTGLRADSALPDPGNNGSIIRDDPTAAPADPRSRWLLFSNTADSVARTRLTLRLSCDDGRSWPAHRVLESGPAGYSTLARLPDGTIGVLYERGAYRYLTFARLRLSWLTTGAGCHTSRP